jgi:hypothetical protein
MNTGQMMLTAFALMLLGATIFTVNKNNVQQGTILRQTEVGIYAVSLATSYVEKATNLNFDEYTVSNMIANGKTDSLTPGKTAGNALGPELTHNGPYGLEKANVDSTFDDFDDYNGFFKVDHVQGADDFTTSISVKYCDTTGAVQASPTRTFYKRMDVKTWGTVTRNAFEGTSSTGTDTIKLSYIFSYIYKI